MARNQSDQWGSVMDTPDAKSDDFDAVGLFLSIWTLIGGTFLALFLVSLLTSSIAPCSKAATHLNPTGLLGECSGNEN